MQGRNIRKRVLFLVLAAAFSLGATCDVSCSGDPLGGIIDLTPDETPLNQARGVITLSQTLGDSQTAVTAALTNVFNNPVRLTGDQTLKVNNVLLVSTDNVTYHQTVPAAAEYVVTVTEPTRYVKTTAIAPPPAFEITGLTADSIVSLRGFTLTWSNPDPSLKVELTLRQSGLAGSPQKTFTDSADAGTHTFSVDDLADFYQGAPITVTVTKVRELAAIDGLGAGTLTFKLTGATTVTPGP